MVILGLDPGLNHFGFGVVDATSVLRAKAWGEIRISPKLAFEEKLSVIRGKFAGLLDEYSPAVAAIEKIYLARNTQIALNIGIVTGIMAGAALERGMKVSFLAPGEIKKLVTGIGSAQKEQVNFMVQKLLALKEVPSLDASDALAAAIGYFANRRFEERIGAA